LSNADKGAVGLIPALDLASLTQGVRAHSVRHQSHYNIVEQAS